jgi:hypothetical protein
MDPIQALVKRYINLAFSISDHLPDYIDAYFGPEKWVLPKAERKDETIPLLKARSEELIQDLHEEDELETKRKKFMIAQAEAMHMATRILDGEDLSLEDKIEGLFNITPVKTPESEFLDIHKKLDALVPAGKSLHTRMLSNDKLIEIPNEDMESVFKEIIIDLQKWTKERFELPSNERFDLQFVKDKAWTGYSEYQGDGLSTIQVNTDVPITLLYAIDFLAHEIYPGHHTESAIKEAELIQGQGRDELSIILALSPFCVTCEGIAMHARDILLEEDTFVEWLDEKILPLAKLDHLDARHQLDIENAWRSIRGVGANAVFMYWVEGEKEERIKEYFLKYSLYPHDYVENWVKKWLPHSTHHLYTFNYSQGYDLLERLFSRTGDPHNWFGKLLRGTYLPKEIESVGF